MMSAVSYTLLADGSSDRLLIPLISWAIRREGVRIERDAWADLSLVEPKPEGLGERAATAVRLYPCDVLFVHRDAEKEALPVRIEEIRRAVEPLGCRYVSVVPVRMAEAWLLHDPAAIRRASGNPNSRANLSLPSWRKIESDPDPKRTLFDALLVASETRGRRRERKKRDLSRMRFRVAELVADYKAIERLPAFRSFLDDLRSALGHARERHQRS